MLALAVSAEGVLIAEFDVVDCESDCCDGGSVKSVLVGGVPMGVVTTTNADVVGVVDVMALVEMAVEGATTAAVDVAVFVLVVEVYRAVGRPPLPPPPSPLHSPESSPSSSSSSS